MKQIASINRNKQKKHAKQTDSINRNKHEVGRFN